MKMNRRQVLDLYNTLFRLGDIKTSTKFMYAMAKNKEVLEKEVENIRLSSNPTDDYLQYEEERRALVISSADKDDKGEPIFLDEDRVKITNVAALEEKIKELDEKYAATLEKNAEFLKQLEEYLAQEVDIRLYKITIESIPDGVLSVDQFGSILPIINEE